MKGALEAAEDLFSGGDDDANGVGSGGAGRGLSGGGVVDSELGGGCGGVGGGQQRGQGAAGGSFTTASGGDLLDAEVSSSSDRGDGGGGGGGERLVFRDTGPFARLQLTFGFQPDSAHFQRESVALLLANQIVREQASRDRLLKRPSSGSPRGVSFSSSSSSLPSRSSETSAAQLNRVSSGGGGQRLSTAGESSPRAKAAELAPGVLRRSDLARYISYDLLMCPQLLLSFEPRVLEVVMVSHQLAASIVGRVSPQLAASTAARWCDMLVRYRSALLANVGKWCRHLELPDPGPLLTRALVAGEQQRDRSAGHGGAGRGGGGGRGGSGGAVWAASEAAAYEVALWHLVWAEAANLRCVLFPPTNSQGGSSALLGRTAESARFGVYLFQHVIPF